MVLSKERRPREVAKTPVCRSTLTLETYAILFERGALRREAQMAK